MSFYIVNGGKALSGEISLKGAKNAAFKQIIATLLSQQTCQINNVPQISDVKITKSIAQKLGSVIQDRGEHCLTITTPKINTHVVPTGTGSKSRSCFMFAAPLLARTGQAVFPVPGGDKLGERPLDRLFDALTQMNVDCQQQGNLIRLSSSQIKPTQYTFPKPSHTVTEVLIMLASVTPGTTVLKNTAVEPEIDDLITMLNRMGADISRQADPKTIIIKGVANLNGVKHQVIADRNEAVTFATAALATKGDINITHIDPQHIKTFLEVIESMGAKVVTGDDEVYIAWQKPLKPVNIETGPQPGFMTDWQAVFTVLLTQAVGISTLIERVWPQRFHHVNHLIQLGAKIKFFNPQIDQPNDYYYFNPTSDKPDSFHAIKIYGPTQLKPANLQVNDLRAGASVTLAALTAPGSSTINGVEYIHRGYEKLGQRLRSLGADIKYVKTKNRKNSN